MLAECQRPLNLSAHFSRCHEGCVCWRQVATLVEADWLFLLTDVDFLYTANPVTNPAAVPIQEVHNIADLQVGPQA